MKENQRPIYLSFFMFTTQMRLYDRAYTALNCSHIHELASIGYSGFELPIGHDNYYDNFASEVEDFSRFRQEIDQQGLSELAFATNVGATAEYDPSADDPAVRAKAVSYLKSRIDITHALRGEIMMGPLVIPYGVYPTDTYGRHLWSDELQDVLSRRYENAQPVLNELGEYAQQKGVKLAIEPITHWETAGPNTLQQLLQFLEGVPCKHVGAVIDSAHETLDGAGPCVFTEQVALLAGQGRLHYAQASPPDRGGLATSWLPWQSLFPPILEHHQGPIAIEIFNAIPAFIDSLRLTRRKYWIPGLDQPNQFPSAYDVAKSSLQKLHSEFEKIETLQTKRA